MIDAHKSVLLAIAAERKRMHAELQELRAETQREFAALIAELEQARDELHATKMEFLRFKQLVTKDKQVLAELARQRMIVEASCAVHDPNMPLQ